MKTPPRTRQRGVALLVLLLVLSLGGIWYLVTGMQQRSTNFTAASRTYNARVLSQAKAAVMGYVAHQAAVSGENNPGAFLCPEAAGNIGTANEGVAASNCALPAVGRLPWKTIGIDKLVDVRGEPLWYVVANGWAKPNSTTNTIINSNCTDGASAMLCYTGQLSVDGQANAAVALIIAPGAAMNVAASPGCTARNQARNAPAPTINPLDYLECYSTATSSFVTTGPSTSFNDQTVKITASEMLPLIEGAVAGRFQKEFAPFMRAAYSGGAWSAPSAFPFAVPFSNPTANPGNKAEGLAATLGGLLPAAYAYVGAGSATCSPTPCTLPAPTPCNPSGSDPRCDPGFVSWRTTANAGCTAASCTVITQTGGASLHSSSSCNVSGTPSLLTCTLNSYVVPSCSVFTFTCFNQLLAQLTATNWMTVNLDAIAANAGMTWKYLNAPPMAPAINGIDTTYKNSPIGYNVPSAALNSDGSAMVRVDARVTTGANPLGSLSGVTCSFFGLQFCYQNSVSVPMALLTDQPILDPSNASYNWFYRNRWPEVTYYSVAAALAPGGGGTCSTGTTCLQLNYSPDAGKHRAILIMGGQKLSTRDAGGSPYTQVRPATVAKDLLDDINADGASPFEVHSASLAPNRGFNDHFAVIDKNP